MKRNGDTNINDIQGARPICKVKKQNNEINNL